MTGVPTAEVLRLRAALRGQARAFFEARDVLEVETPILGHGIIVEAHIDPVACRVQRRGGAQDGYLLASPEAPMKRLLAAGAGSIYQFGAAFRDGEEGRRHAVEFTMLEWYRPGFDHHRLMDEVESLVQTWLPDSAGTRFLRTRYRDLFLDAVGIDPMHATCAEVLDTCRARGVPVPAGEDTRDGSSGESPGSSLDDALDLLLVGALESGLGSPVPQFVYDYPASQAALAKTGVDAEGHAVGSRFELYVGGVELANGYHELTDAAEQRRRFDAANQQRVALGKKPLPVDEGLLAALESGLPDCAGVALGFDRLVMLAAGCEHIDAVRVQSEG